jgi:hypothetical protein
MIDEAPDLPTAVGTAVLEEGERRGPLLIGERRFKPAVSSMTQ